MCYNRKRPRSVSREELLSTRGPAAPAPALTASDALLKRRKIVETASPTSIEHIETPSTDKDDETQEEQDVEYATAAHRDEMVAALLTITSALGLARETLYMCVDLLDRFLALQSVEVSRLEALSISYWTWDEILKLELEVLQQLKFRVISSNVLGLLHKKLHSLEASEADQGQSSVALAPELRQLALYFADLLLLKARANQYSKELLVDSIWFVVSGKNITDVEPPLLAPVVLLFLAHRDNVNPKHAVFKSWFALRCRYGAFLPTPWKVPYDAACVCRVCENVQNELAAP
ncbi:hypothetical protein BBJ28_00009482 [Nothophytophthora sp. Chile5]|nr:hypothetical protein BBJ28_00009482 [Nothophytophthora sp. Chile5]